jgi:hypothetical protein
MTLFFSERRIRIDCYRNGDDYRKKQNATLRRDHVCTEAEWRDIVGWLGAARFNEWDEVYAPGAFDGTAWRLEFLSGTNVFRRFEGVNNWPERFHEFRKVKDFAMKLPEETHAEGAKRAADRAAFLAVPLPRTYVFGTTSWDGGTLSGVAKLFYGDGNKWRVVWEANKAAVPNPDYVLSGTPLVIPALPSP